MAAEKKHDERSVVRDHRRQWRDCLYVYPVISRRARGLSVGVNLNPDKQCNFACPYCQIDRGARRDLAGVDLHTLRDELRVAMRAAVSGEIWSEPRYSPTPPQLRRINDIAFSGDGEPTCLDDFDKAVAAAAEVLHEFARPDIKLVVITNASRLRSPQFRRALPLLDANNGEIWAKLDAGTEEYFRRLNRPQEQITLRQIVDGISEVAAGRAVVIQTLLCKLDGELPADSEIDAYCDRLREILTGGGKIRLVQLHTIARPPSSPTVEALSNAELDALAERIRRAVGKVPVETYYGSV